MGFSLWKELRKRLRRGMRPGGLRLAAWLTAAAVAAMCAVPDAAAAKDRRHEAAFAADAALHRGFNGGGETLRSGRATDGQAFDPSRPQPGIQASTEGGKTTPTGRIEDLPPADLIDAVFGIDANGRLSLFDGPPARGKVLRTFYQLNVRYMESCLPKERLDALVRGIRVMDRDEYNSVLSAYSEYAAYS
jgi:forespore regulator of the sigma-K checkpoint